MISIVRDKGKPEGKIARLYF